MLTKTNNLTNPKNKNQNDRVLKIDTEINAFRDQLNGDLNHEQKSALRQKILKKQTEKKQLIEKNRYTVGTLKTDLDFVTKSVENSQKNYNKMEGIFKRKQQKFSQKETEYYDAQNRAKEYNFSQKKDDFLVFKKFKKLEKNKNNLLDKLTGFEKQLAQKNELVKSAQEEEKYYLEETIGEIEKDFNGYFQNLNKLDLEYQKLEQDYQFLKKKSSIHLTKIQKKLANVLEMAKVLEAKITDLKKVIEEQNQILEINKTKNLPQLNRYEQYQKDHKLIAEMSLLKSDLDSNKKLLERAKKHWDKNITYQNELQETIEGFAPEVNMDLSLIPLASSKAANIFNRVERLLLKDWFFIVIVGMMGAGVVLATFMYIKFGVGALNEIFVVAMLKQGLDSGDYTAALGFASSYIIARILEGPLVGILDVGGAILTGLGVGIPAIFLSSSKLAFMMFNPFYAFLIGLVGGALIGAIVIIIRLFKPKEAANLGTDIMIGAGNATGKFLGPLVVFSAAMFQPLVGLGAGLGAILFTWIKKPIVGGAIMGAMLFGLVPAFA